LTDFADSTMDKLLGLTIEQLCEQVPEAIRPIVREYGSALLNMTAAEVWGWVRLLLDGRPADAYGDLVKKLGADGLLQEWGRISAAWAAAAQRDADAVALQKRALLAILDALLTAALAMLAG